jgi:Skp family chaperone for outer membrane proteins
MRRLSLRIPVRLLATTLAAAFCAALAAPLAAQQVTKVGICDFTKVLSTAYRESKTVRDWEAAKVDYQKEVSATSKEITDLESQKLDADKASNRELSLSLEKKIADRKQYLDNFRRVRGQILQQQAEKALTGQVVRDILSAINLVSEQEGMSLVFRSDGTYGESIIYKLPEVDITEKVIKELFTRAGKTYTGGGQ